MYWKGNTSIFSVRVKIGTSSMKNGMDAPQKIKNGPTTLSGNCSFEYMYLKKMILSQRYLHSHTQCIIIPKSQEPRHLKNVSVSWCMNE